MINKKFLERQLFKLSENRYPGRGFILGKDEISENLVQVYWIMGRSENSRNRIFQKGEDGLVYTEAADPKKVKDPSLIIYNAMMETRPSASHYVVSNGKQTDNVVRRFPGRLSLETSLGSWKYEPDSPNFTPRITGVSSLNGSAQISILRKSPWDDSCEQVSYIYDCIFPGTGYCVTTYMRDGNPLLSFQGEPQLMPISGGMTEIANDYWHALDEDNKVSLAVKFINLKTGKSQVLIANKYSKVS